MSTQGCEESAIEVELVSPVGPRVIVTGELRHEEIEARLPEGWRVHDEDWLNGVKLAEGRWSYPLSEYEPEKED